MRILPAAGAKCNTGCSKVFPQNNNTDPCGNGSCHGGFSVIELLVVVAIIGILVSIAVPAYENYQNERDFLQTRQDILAIQKAIDLYYVKHNRFPQSLVEIDMQDIRDPWGVAYYYVNVASYDKSNSAYRVRRDKKLKPVNSDYDLYSAGKDGETRAPFSAKASWDDIIRCNNGQYLGYVKDY